MIQFITVTFTVVKTHKSKIVHLFYHMEKKCNFALYTRKSLVFISDILCKCICTVYRDLFLQYVRTGCVEVTYVTQVWLVLWTSVSELVHTLLIVRVSWDCAVTADTEREEKHTPLAHKKSHSIPEWRQPLWTVSVIHIYSITAKFKLQ